MKDFFKYFLASLLSSIVIFFIGIIILVIIVFSIVGGVSAKLASEDKESKKLDKEYMLMVDLSTPYPDRVAYQSNSFVIDEDKKKEAIDLYKVQQAIKYAATDKKIKGIYIKSSENANGWVANKEIRDAIKWFKNESKKPVFAYAQNYSQRSYFVASIADSLYLDPAGYIDWNGMGIQTMFYKNLLQKIGINMQVFYVGKYKSATEPFREDKMTPYNKEQLMDILNTYYNIILQNISKSRNISTHHLKEYADNILLINATEAVNKNMITNSVYYHEIENKLKNIVSDNNQPALVSIQDYMNSISEKNETPKIAVVYMEGEIADGNNFVSAKKYRKIFRDIKNDEDIKVVVLRINSPGGSAQESENIWQEITLLKQSKPVIVSMGSVAASGGYYIASAADSIFAMPMTLTGSIGIFGMIPDAKDLANKVGITTDQVYTSPHANMSIFGLDDVQKQTIQRIIEEGYDLFLKRVCEGRHKSFSQVEPLAQGRVWTGLKAKEIGLVDGLANLDSCIKVAAEIATVKSYSIVAYPEPLSWFEKLKKELSGYVATSVQESLPILQYLNADKEMQKANFILQQQGKPLALLPCEIEIK